MVTVTNLGLLIFGIVLVIVGGTLIPLIPLHGMATVGYIVLIVGIILVIIWAILLVINVLRASASG